ncbi:MAG: outer membrane protein assembly factor BamA [Limisphaerales bacterium]|jgi:outer membrane protein assembly factor BamA
MRCCWAIMVIALLVYSGNALGKRSTDCTKGHRYSDVALRKTELRELVNVALLEPQMIVGNLRVVQQDIFPNSNQWLFDKANTWHTPTRTSTILVLLPFAQGDLIDTAGIDEAERLLRNKPYFYDARILIRRHCGSAADLDILVREVWTLTPTISGSRTGGETETKLGIADSNWRGTGRHFALRMEKDAEETQIDVRLKDREERGKWLKKLSATYGQNSRNYAVGVDKPFVSLSTPKAKGVQIAQHKYEKRLYLLGEELVGFDIENVNANLYTARLAHPKPKNGEFVRNRYYYGLRYTQEILDEVKISGTTAFQQRERKFTYPYFAWERISSSFIKTAHLHHFGAVEDVNLGWHFYTEVGYSANGILSNKSTVHLQGRASKSWLTDQNHLASATLSVAGRYNSSQRRPENLLTRLRLAYLYAASDRWRWFAELELRHGRNLDQAHLLELGGSEGLRGYSSHYLSGTRTYKILIEPRYDTKRTPLSLFRLGLVGFIEHGRAWFSRTPAAWANHGESGMLANVGVGIRLDSIRTGSNQTVHVDIARPLISHGRVSSYELTLTVKKGL